MGTLSKYNWLFPLLVLLALLLGTIGFYQYGQLHDSGYDWFTSFYLSLQLFVLNSGGVAGVIPWTLEFARFFAPALTAGGIFLAIWEPLHQNYLMFKIRFWKDHIVVCGLSRKAELLILDFLNQEKEKAKIVLIEPNKDHSGISLMRKKGVIILQGDATDEETLSKANIFQAKYLLAMTQDEKINTLIAQKATHLYNLYPEKIAEDRILQVILHIDDFYTMNIFKEFHEKASPGENRKRSAANKMDYHAFSIYQLAAAFMVDQFSPDQYVSLTEDDDPPAHLLILGDNLAAQYLILEAAQMYHFANLKKPRITVLAEDVTRISTTIESLYPFLDLTVDLSYDTIGHFFSQEVPVHCDDISVCFIAMEDDGQSIYFSRKLRQFMYNHGKQSKTNSRASFHQFGDMRAASPPVKVLLPRNTALVNIFQDVIKEMRSLNIELIDMDDEICNKRTIVDNRKSEDFIAKHIHYEWAKNKAQKNNVPVGTMQEEWDVLKDARKDSNRLPARHLNIKLRYVKAELTDREGGEELNFDDIDTMTWERIAQMEHHRWNAEKFINGYVQIPESDDRNLGAFLNHNLKCHWDLIPFDQLRPDIQAYDTFTFRMAPVIARLNQKRIMRKA